MHHRGEAHRADRRERHAVLFFDVLCKLGIAILHALADSVQRIGPNAVDVLVLPLMAARCDGRIGLIHQDRLDARRAKLDAERGRAFFDAKFCLFLHNNPLTISFQKYMPIIE